MKKLSLYFAISTLSLILLACGGEISSHFKISRISHKNCTKLFKQKQESVLKVLRLKSELKEKEKLLQVKQKQENNIIPILEELEKDGESKSYFDSIFGEPDINPFFDDHHNLYFPLA